ncbi:hypothetical protein PZT57_26200 [Pseudomonas aeruginosa]|uniref:hypothetical protein n=1 Tax=Pseudomonas aeruginosa TaxID=287 RepID=UPI002B2698D0|nr:hypothetical protein [Pseudomonas aeruginosa]MEA8592140.1 hypothetical protein [Pseudomonas aeruginosa]
MIEQFTAKDGLCYTITITEEGDEITIERKGTKLGSISLDFHGGEAWDNSPDRYHITDLSLEQCKGKGIGQRCLEFHIEVFGMKLTAGVADRGEAPDGSHLIRDGVGFISRMREKGIVCPSEFDIERPEWDED